MEGETTQKRHAMIPEILAEERTEAGAERLHKILAHAGLGARRKCEGLIRAGKVAVNGAVVREVGTKVDPKSDDIRCDGRKIRPEPRVVLLLNKPRGYVCTTSDERGRKTVLDLVRTHARLYPAGRLDAESQGMVILTNDGALCERITHPRHGVEKAYRAIVRGYVPDEIMERVRRGIWFSEGRASPARVRTVFRSREHTDLEVVLQEGKKREIRRIFARFGLKVRRLKRVRIGGVALGGLREGEHRALREDEVERLFARKSKSY